MAEWSKAIHYLGLNPNTTGACERVARDLSMFC